MPENNSNKPRDAESARQGNGQPQQKRRGRPRVQRPAQPQEPVKNKNTAAAPLTEQTKNAAQILNAAHDYNSTKQNGNTQIHSAARNQSSARRKSAGRSNNAASKNTAQAQAAPQNGRVSQTAANMGATARTSPNIGRGRGRPPKKRAPLLRIIPLGGLGEVGKNVTVIECGNDSFVLDCGMTFPDESMPGVDLVIPDFSYIVENKDRIKGIVITHGHEDHIGGLPFLLKQADFPVYGTKLTLGLLENKLKEHGLLAKTRLNVVKPGDVLTFGEITVEYINVNHSIPDACGLAINTPAGLLVHSGDFKIDFTPIRGDIINLARFGELGSHGVLALMSDSTNAERPGSTMSERTVGESFDKLFQQYAEKRIIVATFASNVHRVQQIVDAAVKYRRKVAVSGRSMENVMNKALEIGYLEIPDGVLVDVDSVHKYPDGKMVIITTGSQGEPMSALTRMALGDHRKLTVTTNDCIIISATPIPGNEKLVTRVVNELMKLGADVVYEKMYDIHVSGHACQDELKMMLALTRPKFFIPVHGEFKHLTKHASVAISMGIDPANVMVGDIGKVIVTDGETIKTDGVVQSGKVLVDGLGVGDVGSIVLRDRKHLAQDGLIVVVTTVDRRSGDILSGPDIVSRGFVYVRESEDMIVKARSIARESIRRCMEGNSREWGVIKQRVRDDLGDYLWQVTKRSPMILPVIQEI